MISFCTFSAQAFQDVFSDFDAWLRETERKIQRDDPLKLEVKELRSGLAYLKVSFCLNGVRACACV